MTAGCQKARDTENCQYTVVVTILPIEHRTFIWLGEQSHESATQKRRCHSVRAQAMDEQAGPGVFFNNNSILSGGGKGLLPEGDAAEAARSPYSIPGILHFLQHEWARFDVEKVQWELQRAELQAQIAFLQGERKGQENLKKDLVRRIKMLEYALKQERSKYHKLKYGTELNQGDVKPPSYDYDEVIENETPGSLNNQLSWKQGRQLLRQYLQEVGYADTILDVKSRRVQTLLCLAGDGGGPVERTANGTDTRTRGGKTEQSESSVVQEAFRFIESSAADYSDEDDDEDGSGNDRTIMERTGPTGTIVRKKPSSALSTSMDTSEDPDTEDALKGFDFLSSPDDMDTSPESRSAGNGTNWGPNRSKLQDMLANLRDQEDMNPREPSSTSQSRSNAPRLNDHHQDNNTDEVEVLTVPPSSGKAFILGPDVNMEAELGLGELAGLTVSNEADSLTYDMSNNKDALRRTWNPKFTLRSHFDGIRGLAFHPVEAVLVTASEDHTLKMWNLQKTSPTKKNASVDVEPMHTFRAHQGAVLCVVMSSTGEQCFSGGLDGTIQSWNTPNPNLDPYDSYEPSVLRGALCGHTDSVWGLVYSGVYQRLLSCSGDGTVRLWDASDTKPALVTFRSKEFGVPSSVDVVSSDPAHMVTSFTSGQIGLFNMETQQLVLSLESAAETGTPCQINKVLSHPTLPITITAEEDKHIKFYDNNTGKLVHSMVAHLDAVTSLAVDPNGLYLMSGSHDCSIRLWNLETKTCVQEFTAHRKKNDESIHDVAFHPSKAYIASAGADALAKVFV
ncbi:striatin isoform X2 [Oncorhynchus mykiss]|uniref:striatin isoform X2 n=1 Tax=Oncorhynchus mykiss TaxID=8022 RepID=UPI0018785AB2|nr:striatin isoform X2 [Oncorhynchus mykiss]